MALLNVNVFTTVLTVSAGDADEFQAQATAAIATIPTSDIIDFDLTGGSAGLAWQGWFTVGALNSGTSLLGAAARFLATQAGNADEAKAALLDKIAAGSVVPGDLTPLLIRIAMSGNGTDFMAIALCQLGGG
jgi:hypothetical protein